MVEKHVKIFNIRLKKLQQAAADASDIVSNMLIEQNRDDLCEAPEYKLKSMRMIMNGLSDLVSDMKNNIDLLDGNVAEKVSYTARMGTIELNRNLKITVELE